MARTCYEQSLDVEPTWERGYQGLMRGHDQLGQPDEVVRVYHRCREALANSSLPPSPATERLYRHIIGAGSASDNA